MDDFGEEALNINGKRTVRFCMENELLIGNTYCSQKMENRYTLAAEDRNSTRKRCRLRKIWMEKIEGVDTSRGKTLGEMKTLARHREE